MKQDAIYITSHEGLRSALVDVLKECNLIRPTEECFKPTPPATRKEAGEFLGISLPTLDILLKTNQIKSFNIGRQVRINWSDLELYLEEKGRIVP